MFNDIEEGSEVTGADEDEVRVYLRKLLHKEAFDQKGSDLWNGTCRFIPYLIHVPQCIKAYVEKLWPEKRAG